MREARRGDFDLLVIVAASMLLFLLVIARVLGLVRQNERTVSRERALRLASLALVRATTPAEIRAAALGTAQALVDGAGEARLCLVAPDGLVVMTASAGPEDALPPTAVALLERAATTPNARVELPHDVHAQLDLPAGFDRANVFPLAARNQRRLLIARGADAVLADSRGALHSLADSVSLALGSAELTEEHAPARERSALRLARAQRERPHHGRRHATGIIGYQSPSIERILGYTRGRCHGISFQDLLVAGDRGRLRQLLHAAAYHGSSRSQAFECTLCHRRRRAPSNSRSSRPTCSTTSTSAGSC